MQRGYRTKAHITEGMEIQVGDTSGHGFTVCDNVWCILGHAWECSYKLNDQPVREPRLQLVCINAPITCMLTCTVNMLQ